MSAAPGRLASKNVLVTGGGHGIGRAICELFAREGARVAILDIDQKGADETLSLLTGSGHCSIKADVSNPDQVKQAFESAEKNFGKKCDVVVNNAGILGKLLPICDLDAGDFDNVINVNAKGVFLVAKEYLNSVKSVEQDVRGVLINISSPAAHIAPFSFGAYSASKAAVVALSKTIANEFSVHRVRCNAVKPGFTDTAIYQAIDPDLREAIGKSTPMQRIGTVDEIAYGCLYLASSESSFVHGANLEIGGGLTG